MHVACISVLPIMLRALELLIVAGLVTLHSFLCDLTGTDLEVA